MAIFLIRHAQSIANMNQRTQNHHSIPLSREGHIQAQALIARLPTINHVIVSRFTRTQQTAQPLLAYYDLVAEVHDDLHEFSYLSDFQCQNTNLDERKAWVDAYWEKMDIHYQHAADAESFATLYQRVERVIQQLVQWQRPDQHSRSTYQQDDHLAIFSHGQFLQLLKMQIQQHRPLSTKLMQQFRIRLIEQPIANTHIYKCPEI